MAYRKQRMDKLLAHLAAEFLARQSGPQSLITVVGANYDSQSDTAIIFFTVLPEEKTGSARYFVERQSGSFREYLGNRSRLRSVPRIKFVLKPIGEF